MWLQGGPLPGAAGTQGSPAAIPWPGGGVAVFSQLAGAAIGYAVGTGAAAGTWSGWTRLGSAMLGSPTAWLDASGEPQAAILNSRRKLAIAGYASSSWTGWSSMASGF